jgi:Ca2+-binding RTX toxin-like protein
MFSIKDKLSGLISGFVPSAAAYNLSDDVGFPTRNAASKSTDDVLHGGAGDDRLVGGDGNDRLHGGAGDDRLVGGDGNDRLSGGAGDDVMDGGAGNDLAFGGAGDDLYAFGSGDGSDQFSGGSGWTDTISLEGTPSNSSPFKGWSLQLDDDSHIEMSGNGMLDLSEDAAGVITFDDGSELIFTGVDQIEW